MAYSFQKIEYPLYIDRKVATSIVSAIVFTIAIVSIVFKFRDFHSKLLGLGSKKMFNGSRMYMFLYPMHFNTKLVPKHT